MAPLSGKLVLYGGMGSNLNPIADTWTWDGSAWTQLDAIQPGGREGAMMAPVDGRLVLFGGRHGQGGDALSDTWAFDGSAWTQLDVTGAPGRSAAAMATWSTLAGPDAGHDGG
jgi:N-acetylneuraminic acid mutarotase